MFMTKHYNVYKSTLWFGVNQQTQVLLIILAID